MSDEASIKKHKKKDKKKEKKHNDDTEMKVEEIHSEDSEKPKKSKKNKRKLENDEQTHTKTNEIENNEQKSISSTSNSEPDKKKKKKDKKSEKMKEPEVSMKADSSDDEDSDYEKLKNKKGRNHSNSINKSNNDVNNEYEITPINNNNDSMDDISSLKKSHNNKDYNQSNQPITPTSANGGDNVRMFLGNLPFKITDKLIYDTFGTVGNIVNIHYVTDKETGQFYGTAFVDYENEEQAKKSLQFNGKELLGRPCKVGFATGENKVGANRNNSKEKKGGHLAKAPISDKPEGTTTVFLGNLSFSIDEETIREKFSSCGEITQIRWVEKDGEFKGCGFIEFTNTQATDEAVKLNGSSILGRPVRVDYSGGK